MAFKENFNGSATEQSTQEIQPKVENKAEVITTPEALNEHGREAISLVEKSSQEALNLGLSRVEKAVGSIGGTPEDIQHGQEALSEVNGAITELRMVTVEKIYNLTASSEKRARPTFTAEELQVIRSKTKEDYGVSLVKKNQKGTKTLEAKEAAQRQAYAELTTKIESGAVRPDSINADMLDRLGLSDKVETAVERNEQVIDTVQTEISELLGRGLIKEGEAALIMSEASHYSEIYMQAFPEATPQQIFEVTRDNARKLAFQTERDKQVFSGSDHGTRHILEGNMTMADRMIAGLGDRITPKDALIIHQIIIDHDMGYTVGVAQAPGSFDASKDHPLFSTAYVEANQEYYTDLFGAEGFQMIRDGILQHSYPKSDYDTPTDPAVGFNPDIIRSITSTVDSLGVTAETKCPAFFREPEAVRTLLKIKLYADTHDGQVAPEAMEKYKEELRSLANREPDQNRRDGFLKAINDQFNSFTVDATLGQYVGVLRDVQMTQKDGKIVPRIQMDVSRMQALIGNLFGDKLAMQAFNKAMEDFGVTSEAMATIAETIKALKVAKTEEEKEMLKNKLTESAGPVIFEFSSDFVDGPTEISQTFENFSQITVSKEVMETVKRLDAAEARTPENITAIMGDFLSSLDERADEEYLQGVFEIQQRLLTAIDNPEEFTNAWKQLQSLTTKGEREFMGI